MVSFIVAPSFSLYLSFSSPFFGFILFVFFTPVYVFMCCVYTSNFCVLFILSFIRFRIRITICCRLIRYIHSMTHLNPFWPLEKEKQELFFTSFRYSFVQILSSPGVINLFYKYIISCLGMCWKQISECMCWLCSFIHLSVRSFVRSRMCCLDQAK